MSRGTARGAGVPVASGLRRPRPAAGFATVETAVAALGAGRMILLVDDGHDEDDGALAMAASKVTPAAINFMARHGRGLVMTPLTGDRLDALRIPPMPADSPGAEAFHTSVDARERTTTGISAYDRAATIQVLVDPSAKPGDVTSPGHTFPLRVRQGGVLGRAARPEAIVDLARLAGLAPAGVLCDVMTADGTLARLPLLRRLAARHHLPVLTVKDLIGYRMRREVVVSRTAEAWVPTRVGRFRAVLYRSELDGKHHVVLTMGDVANERPTLVRLHSECLTGDALGSLRCDCGGQLQGAMAHIAREGRGAILYIRQEGRGIGLANKLRAYELQDQGLDTVEANVRLGFEPDPRDYGVGAQMLVDLGVRALRLMTNNPQKIVGLEGYGLRVVERVPMETSPTTENVAYLQTKRDKLGHLIDVPARPGRRAVARPAAPRR
jgi:3,4-dihydroxy 2-butanone 4-phosphate synthase/GTP cyclohydrolase II